MRTLVSFHRWVPVALLLLLQSCIFVVREEKKNSPVDSASNDTLVSTDSSAAYPGGDTMDHPLEDTASHNELELPEGHIDTKNVQPQQIIEFAKTLIGTPYKYASTDPKVGFDCSGFITYVFSHFGITVPRSSIDFTNVGREVAVTEARPGDLILFTGTDSTERFVGHMGIIYANEYDKVSFIHSTSGKAWGVTITPLNDYYKGRYVKTIRIFPQNNR